MIVTYVYHTVTHENDKYHICHTLLFICGHADTNILRSNRMAIWQVIDDKDKHMPILKRKSLKYLYAA